MINDDEAEKYYFAVKNKLELHYHDQLRSKKEAIINSNNCFQNALNDALLDRKDPFKRPAKNIKN